MGKRFYLEKAVKFPSAIGRHKIMIKENIVDNEIPLQFSQSSINQALMKTDFEKVKILFNWTLLPSSYNNNIR